MTYVIKKKDFFIYAVALFKEKFPRSYEIIDVCYVFLFIFYCVLTVVTSTVIKIKSLLSNDIWRTLTKISNYNFFITNTY